MSFYQNQFVDIGMDGHRIYEMCFFYLFSSLLRYQIQGFIFIYFSLSSSSLLTSFIYTWFASIHLIPEEAWWMNGVDVWRDETLENIKLYRLFYRIRMGNGNE
ncbi:hypothetical protein ACMFMG_007394 [Clarireedia jacksonii]